MIDKVETMNCKGCGKDKPIPEMFVRGGKPIRTCRICRALQMGVGRNGPKPTDKRIAALADKVAAKTARKHIAPVADAAPILIIDPGYGIEATIDDGYLKLIQRDEAGAEDTMMISKAEARRVFEAFGQWAAA